MEMVAGQWYCVSDCTGTSHLTWIDDKNHACYRTPERGQAISWERHADGSYQVFMDGVAINLPEHISGVRFE